MGLSTWMAEQGLGCWETKHVLDPQRIGTYAEPWLSTRYGTLKKYSIFINLFTCMPIIQSNLIINSKRLTLYVCCLD